jgi:hypothetical protein
MKLLSVHVDPCRLAPCKHCGASLVWLKSTRTGKRYPVNYDGMIDDDGRLVVMKNDFHYCPRGKHNGE